MSETRQAKIKILVQNLIIVTTNHSNNFVFIYKLWKEIEKEV